jgi:prevent-host-death family protein
MINIGVSKARASFGSLLERAGKGEEILITRHGRPVARLAPLREAPRERRREAIRRLKEFAKGQTLGDLTVQKLREQGRRS